MRKRGDLSEKHWKFLKAVEDGSSRKDAATLVGWKIDYMKKMCAGDIEACGYTADVFKKELLKIETKRSDETKMLVEENTHSAQTLIKGVLTELKSKKTLDYEEKKLLATLTNALNKSTPSVSIGSLSYSYTKGLTPEELIHEFTRLKTIAEGSFNRRPIQKSLQGGSGELLEVDERGSRLAQDS